MQLLTLRRELGKTKDDASIKVSPEVLALLHSISTEISPAIVTDAVCSATTTVTTPPLELNDSEEEESLLSERPGSDEESSPSAKPLKNKCIPTITEGDLTESQREIMANIAHRLNCSKQLVLICIEKHQGKDFDRYDLEKWCSHNLDLLDESEEESSSDEDSYSSRSSESDDSEQEDQQFKHSSSFATAAIVYPAHAPEITRIERAAREKVDENNSMVQDLVNAGYAMEKSIDAVDRYPTVKAAMEYLDKMEDDEDEDKDDSGVIPVVVGRLPSEDSQDDTISEWVPGGDPSITFDPGSEDKYLPLETLGEVLSYLSQMPGQVQRSRTFPASFLKKGYPNLIVVQPGIYIAIIIMHTHWEM
jgi:hypothetical protein